MRRPHALRTALAMLTVLALGLPASAHYLWVAIASSGDQDRVNIYFEGGPGPGDGRYLDPLIKTGTTWVRTVDAPQGAKLAMTDTKNDKHRWLTAQLGVDAPRSIDSYAKFGTYRYGKIDVLLHYYARHLDVASHDDLHELARAEQLALDIVPHDTPAGLQVQVLWQGKPAAGRPLAVRGPAGFKASLKTDAQGRATIKAEKSGQYTLRTSVQEEKSGEDDGNPYQQIRHHATMILKLPLES